jgi:hypothetical protein
VWAGDIPAVNDASIHPSRPKYTLNGGRFRSVDLTIFFATLRINWNERNGIIAGLLSNSQFQVTVK